MKIKALIRKMVYGHKASSESYIQYLRKSGVEIGEDCIFYGPNNIHIDVQYPWMISIGNHVRIAHGTVILTHDFAWSVLKKLKSESVIPGAILGASGKVRIGNNVFIGINSIITRDVTIGDNVIIGTGSVVTKDCPSNGVYAGNPAKYIMSIEEYFMKRRGKQLEEAKNLVLEYYKRYGKKPDKKVLREYFMLFTDSMNAIRTPEYAKTMSLCSNMNESIEYLDSVFPKFSSYEEFLEFCFSEQD